MRIFSYILVAFCRLARQQDLYNIIIVVLANLYAFGALYTKREGKIEVKGKASYLENGTNKCL